MEIMSKELWMKTSVCAYIYVCIRMRVCMIMSQPRMLEQQQGWDWDRMEKRRK